MKLDILLMSSNAIAERNGCLYAKIEYIFRIATALLWHIFILYEKSWHKLLKKWTSYLPYIIKRFSKKKRAIIVYVFYVSNMHIYLRWIILLYQVWHR